MSTTVDAIFYFPNLLLFCSCLINVTDVTRLQHVLRYPRGQLVLRHSTVVRDHLDIDQTHVKASRLEHQTVSELGESNDDVVVFLFQWWPVALLYIWGFIEVPHQHGRGVQLHRLKGHTSQTSSTGGGACTEGRRESDGRGL